MKKSDRQWLTKQLKKDRIKYPKNEPLPIIPKRKTKKAMEKYMFACGRYAGFGNAIYYTKKLNEISDFHKER